MRKCLPYLLLATVADLPLALAQSNEAPVSITISADTNVFKAGSEVRIRLVLKNTSSGEIPYKRTLGTGVEPNGEFFSQIEVRGSKGQMAPETKYYRLLQGKPDTSAKSPAVEKSGTVPATSVRPEPLPMFFGSFTAHMLKPGEFREEDIVVSKLYDLSQPGQYTISASRRLSNVSTDPNSKIVAKSNTLTISITR